MGDTNYKIDDASNVDECPLMFPPMQGTRTRWICPLMIQVM
ncbi:MAG: hypothetical protein ACOCT7_01870 [Candidatus Saliniplasma sp.]